jgi:hypothetical protein
MNWYKIAQSHGMNLRGKWWFYDGNAVNSNDNSNEGYGKNDSHESVARKLAQDEMSGSFYEILKEYKQELEKLDLWDEVMSEDIYKAWGTLGESVVYGGTPIQDEMAIKLIAKHGKYCVNAVLDLEAEPFSATDWALRQGLVRCSGENLEVWSLNYSTMNEIIVGLRSVYGESGLLKDDTEFHLSQRSNDAYFTNIPFSVLNEKNALSIYAYKEKST